MRVPAANRPQSRAATEAVIYRAPIDRRRRPKTLVRRPRIKVRGSPDTRREKRVATFSRLLRCVHPVARLRAGRGRGGPAFPRGASKVQIEGSATPCPFEDVLQRRSPRRPQPAPRRSPRLLHLDVDRGHCQGNVLVLFRRGRQPRRGAVPPVFPPPSPGAMGFARSRPSLQHAGAIARTSEALAGVPAQATSAKPRSSDLTPDARIDRRWKGRNRPFADLQDRPL